MIYGKQIARENCHDNVNVESGGGCKQRINRAKTRRARSPTTFWRSDKDGLPKFTIFIATVIRPAVMKSDFRGANVGRNAINSAAINQINIPFDRSRRGFGDFTA